MLFKEAINKAGSIVKLSKIAGINERRICDYRKENYGNKFGVRKKTIDKITKFLKFKDKDLKRYIIKEVHSDWTKNEINFLIKNYKEMTARELSKKLGRSVYSVKDQRRILNLRKGPSYRWDSREKIINRFKELYDKVNRTPTYEECRNYDAGMLNALHRNWGKYRDFLKELNLTAKFNRWSKEDCIKKFKKFVNKYKYVPPIKDPNLPKGLIRAIQRRWRSYDIFLEENTINTNLRLRDKWKKWEELVIKICKAKYKNILIKTKLNGKRLFPDVSVIDKEGKVNKIIDAKLNSYSSKIDVSINNYYKYCKNIEFWCLYGNKSGVLYKPGVKLRNYENIKEDLENNNLNMFIKNIEELRKPC